MEVELKKDELIFLLEEISERQNIQSVTWLLQNELTGIGE